MMPNSSLIPTWVLETQRIKVFKYLKKKI